MARLPFETEYLYGLHDPGGERLMRDAGRKGWILFTEGIGHDPGAAPSDDRYAALNNEGFGVIVRLNNGYYNAGTLPRSEHYEDFARCCANFVARSPGARIWIIGNEMNMAAERPGVEIDWSRGPVRRGAGGPIARDFRDFLAVPNTATRAPRGQISGNPGETITPELYVRCYGLCRKAIKGVPGHEGDLVLIGAVAPWNVNTGDWIEYFRKILTLLGPKNCDGITLHTYTHGVEPELIDSPEKMQSSPGRHYHFRAYQDFMNAIPANMRHLPVYITETDQDVAWSFENRGWVQRAYGEIDHWNKQPGHQQIRAVILYRWPRLEGHQWWIDGNDAVIAGFREAMGGAYRWNPDAVGSPGKVETGDETAPVTFSVGQEVFAAAPANVRRSPGHLNKPADDVLGQVVKGTPVVIRASSQQADGLTWWPVRTTAGDGQQAIEGWIAQSAPGGKILLGAKAPRAARGAATKRKPRKAAA
jgi:hypothetical protein